MDTNHIKQLKSDDLRLEQLKYERDAAKSALATNQKVKQKYSKNLGLTKEIDNSNTRINKRITKIEAEIVKIVSIAEIFRMANNVNQ